MTIRHGALLKFAEGLTREEIVAALKTIKHVLDPESLTRNEYSRDADGKVVVTKRPVTNKEMVHKYDDEHGDPIWYIP